MEENFLETRINLVFFFAGAGVGILGGLLSGFCVTSYYRWFDYYNTEIQIHPNSFPISIDFWVFIVSLIAVLGIGFFIYCWIKKILKKIAFQQRLIKTTENDEKSIKENIFPIVIEKCPICGKIFKGQSDYCEICGKKLSDSSQKKDEFQSFGIIIEFFKSDSKLFTILATIATIIALTPVFVNFVFGENWLNLVLASPLGIQTLILILISSLGIVFFIIFILVLIFLDFWNFVINHGQLSIFIKIQSTIFMIIGLFAIGCSFLFLIFIWFTKLDILISLIGVYLLYFEIAIPFSLMFIGFFLELINKSNKCLAKVVWSILCLILIVAIVVISIPVFQGAFAMSDEISKYYSNKTVLVNIEHDIVNRSGNTSIILSLKGNIDAYFSKNVSYFDANYAQCRWSTNYGYFIRVTSNKSVIQKRYQELIIPGCGYPGDKIYWTYDIGDYGKSKPYVLIGLNLEDPNKKVNNQLGDAHLVINWTDTDAIKFDDDSLSIFK
jgi:MFS family permease